jgi:adenosyl cobinamide kinase/adenosyl cobinamide phosphate guanylyltransferase
MCRHPFILGGQRSGKSRQAERLARAWLDQDARHEVLVSNEIGAGVAPMGAGQPFTRDVERWS